MRRSQTLESEGKSEGCLPFRTSVPCREGAGRAGHSHLPELSFLLTSFPPRGNATTIHLGDLTVPCAKFQNFSVKSSLTKKYRVLSMVSDRRTTNLAGTRVWPLHLSIFLYCIPLKNMPVYWKVHYSQGLGDTPSAESNMINTWSSPNNTTGRPWRCFGLSSRPPL